MKKRIFASILIALSMAGSVFAETTQKLLINGEQVDKVVNCITFDGDNVVLHFDDGTESHDMNLVSLALEHSTGLNNLNMFAFNGRIEGSILKVSGVDAGTPIFIYNLSGAIATSAKADSDGNAVLDVQSLPGGIYIMQAGNNCVKFIKH